MRALKSLAWFFIAFLLTVYAGLSSAQGLKPAERRVVYQGVTYSTPMAHCLGRTKITNPTASRYCNSDGKFVSPSANALWGTEGPAVNYTWYYGYCSGSSDTSCTALGGTKPDRYCANGEVPQNGPVSGEKYCTFEQPPVKCLADGEVFTDTWYRGTVKPGIEDAGSDDVVDPQISPAGNPHAFVGGCEIKVVDVVECYMNKVTRKAYCTYKHVRTGNQKQLDGIPGAPNAPDNSSPRDSESDRTDVPPFTPAQGDCPKGTVQIGVSDVGTPQCAGTGSNPKNTPPAPPKVEVEKNEPTDDGGTKNTKTVTTKNSDGSTTTKTTVTIIRPNGQKEISEDKVTTNKPSGGAGKETLDPKDDKSDLCKQNPYLAVCKNSTVSGKCGDITCSGDAIQCATLRAAAAMQCEQASDKDALKALPQTALGNSILSGSDPMKGEIDLALKGTEVDLSKPGLDDTGFLGGGACLPNKTMTVMGRAVTVEFSQICSSIQPLRGVIMACAFILAYMIVSRSVLQS